MNLLAMRTAVQAACLGISKTDAELNTLINEGFANAAMEVVLPGLKRIDTVQTVEDTAYVSLTALDGGFSGRLRRVGSADAVTVLKSLEELMDLYPGMDETGEAVEYVALEGNNLWYQPIPSSVQTLNVLYLQNPATLSADIDIPSDFPNNLHNGIGVCWAAYRIWEIEEDEQEGNRVNTVHYLSMYENAVQKLREHIARSRRHCLMSWED